MTTKEEITELAALLGVAVTFGVENGIAVSVSVEGDPCIGRHPMPMVQAAERLRKRVSDKAGAAILGFRGAIRCCRQAGLDEERVFRLVLERGCD